MNEFAVLLSAFFRCRVLIAFALCAIAAFFGLLSFGAIDVGIQAFGGADVDLIGGNEFSPHITQNESAVWGHGTPLSRSFRIPAA